MCSNRHVCHDSWRVEARVSPTLQGSNTVMDNYRKITKSQHDVSARCAVPLMRVCDDGEQKRVQQVERVSRPCGVRKPVTFRQRGTNRKSVLRHVSEVLDLTGSASRPWVEPFSRADVFPITLTTFIRSILFVSSIMLFESSVAAGQEPPVNHHSTLVAPRIPHEHESLPRVVRRGRSAPLKMCARSGDRTLHKRTFGRARLRQQHIHDLGSSAPVVPKRPR